jgi:hypothetical protein
MAISGCVIGSASALGLAGTCFASPLWPAAAALSTGTAVRDRAAAHRALWHTLVTLSCSLACIQPSSLRDSPACECEPPCGSGIAARLLRRSSYAGGSLCVLPWHTACGRPRWRVRGGMGVPSHRSLSVTPQQDSSGGGAHGDSDGGRGSSGTRCGGAEENASVCVCAMLLVALLGQCLSPRFTSSPCESLLPLPCTRAPPQRSQIVMAKVVKTPHAGLYTHTHTHTRARRTSKTWEDPRDSL